MATFFANLFFYLLICTMGLVLLKKEFKNPLVEKDYDWGKTVMVYYTTALCAVPIGWFAFLSKNPGAVLVMAVIAPVMFSAIYKKNAIGYNLKHDISTCGRAIGAVAILGNGWYMIREAAPFQAAWFSCAAIIFFWLISFFTSLTAPERRALKTKRTMAFIRKTTCKPFNEIALTKEYTACVEAVKNYKK